MSPTSHTSTATARSALRGESCAITSSYPSPAQWEHSTSQHHATHTHTGVLADRGWGSCHASLPCLHTISTEAWDVRDLCAERSVCTDYAIPHVDAHGTVALAYTRATHKRTHVVVSMARFSYAPMWLCQWFDCRARACAC